MATKKTAASDQPHPDRTHESNMVEIESLDRTLIVDGRRYGPFSAEAPKEKRMVPRALVDTFLLTEKKGGSAAEDPEMIDTGTGGERLSGIETPEPVEGQVPATEDEKEEAAEAAGHSTEQQLAKRDVRLGNAVAAASKPSAKKK